MQYILLVVVNFFLIGCTNHVLSNKDQEAKISPQDLIEKYPFDIVAYDYVKQAVGLGTRKNAKSILIDACPHEKYLSGTIPSSINIPDTDIEAFIDQLDHVSKDHELIVFCGDLMCNKASIVATYLQKKGFSNIKVYSNGEPEWSRKNYTEIGLSVVQNRVERNSAFLIDARPYHLYLAGTIPGAVSIQDSEIENLKDRLPNSKKIEIITFCAGYFCMKAHNLARDLQKFGYENVSVFAGGYPEWETLGMTTIHHEANYADTASEQKKDSYIDGIKLLDDGKTIDSEWLKAMILNDTVPTNIAIVDVRTIMEYHQGHIKNSINIDTTSLDALSLFNKLPKNQYVVFTCNSGIRSLEAFYKLKKAGINMSKMFYFNAGFTCNQQNQCTIKVNKPLGIK